MIKRTGIVIMLICALCLFACGGAEDEVATISPPDLTTEDGIKEYLVGDWSFDNGYVSDVVCDMSIDKDLNVHLSFQDSYSDGPKSEYSGLIKLDRAHAQADEAPDLLVIELSDTDYPGGDFFFLHRTIYDEKRVMSWFYKENGPCIFDVLGPEGYQDVPEEIMFEKTTGESPQLSPIINGEFQGVFWGIGEGESLWIDDAKWTPSEANDYTALYPLRMTFYENRVQQSALYKIAPDMVSEILGDDLFPGGLYSIRTDKEGNINYFVSVEYEVFLKEGSGGSADLDIEALVLEIMERDVEEIKGFINSGLTLMVTGETMTLEGEESYLVDIGENSDGQFYPNMYYAVNTNTRQVHYYDILKDSWNAY